VSHRPIEDAVTVAIADGNIVLVLDLGRDYIERGQTSPDGLQRDPRQDAAAAVYGASGELGGAGVEGAIGVRRGVGSVEDGAAEIGGLEHLDVNGGNIDHCWVVLQVCAPGQQVNDVGDVEVDVKAVPGVHRPADFDGTEGGSGIGRRTRGVSVDA
jgi:hypothetical protein